MTNDSHTGEHRGPALMTKIKITLAVIVAVLVLIVVFQNIESVTTRVLWVEIPMPRALLLFVMLAIGFGAGVLVTGAAYRRRAKD